MLRVLRPQIRPNWFNFTRLNSSKIAAELKKPPFSVPVPPKKSAKKKKNQKAGLNSLRWSDKQVHDNQSKLLTLLAQTQRKEVDQESLAEYLKPVTSLTIGESIDLDKVRSTFKKKKVPHSVVIRDEVLLCKVNSKDIMVLANGTLVGWDIAEDSMNEYVPQIWNAVSERYENESEEMDYISLEPASQEADEQGPSFVQEDVFVSQGTDPEQRLLEKAAFAIGLSRSTRLSILEESLEKHIQLTRENSEALSKGLKLKTKESEILKLTGQPNLEKIYESISRRLDIQSRISIMNRKLDYITEEQRALLSVLNEKKGTRLEWTIIILIMVEVGFETFHFVEKYWWQI
ncbi:hypothetical protein CXQ85_002005 [Candidozyma haemuli]|uniref:DUF155 domain-containing protein n=1 Tax=Candidozyma haemuli TaxID=45357 RepID=A0A2V1ATF4_9ASCO|nr:hypothetical protein CXQ85_002005 [[Candida] haemuloni]PVH20221.1 hypothetical protein CXQ85_002005 [[Candida] haemuloni]